MNARVLAPLLALVVIAATAGCGFWRPQPVRISAQFPDSVGLYVGNNVAVLGITVGTVTAIHPSGTHVTVELALDPGVKIPADASAVTVSPSLITDRRVELTPAYRGGPVLRDGDVIGLDRTRTPVEIDQVFAAADRIARQLDAVRTPGGRPVVADALGVAADTFAGNGDKLHRSLRGLAAAIGVGADNRDQLVDLIRDVDHLSGVAADNDATIRSFATNLTEATALADQQGPHLVRILRNLDDLLNRANQIVTANHASGARVLADLRVTARTLAGHTRELSEAVDIVPTLLQNAINTLDPKLRVARTHVSIDQTVVDTQLLSLVCRRMNKPPSCSSGDSPTGKLLHLMLGGGR